MPAESSLPCAYGHSKEPVQIISEFKGELYAQFAQRVRRFAENFGETRMTSLEIDGYLLQSLPTCMGLNRFTSKHSLDIVSNPPEQGVQILIEVFRRRCEFGTKFP